MKIARFMVDNKVYYGMIEAETIRVIEGNIFQEFRFTTQAFKISEVKLLAPVQPGKVIGVGLHENHHEAELVVVIGRECRNIPREMTNHYILGYTCG